MQNLNDITNVVRSIYYSIWLACIRSHDVGRAHDTSYQAVHSEIF